MFRKYVLPVLAAAGFAFALWTAMQGAKPIPPSKPVAEPPKPPYENKISGSGIVEASTRNISVGTPVTLSLSLMTGRSALRSHFARARWPRQRRNWNGCCNCRERRNSPQRKQK